MGVLLVKNKCTVHLLVRHRCIVGKTWVCCYYVGEVCACLYVGETMVCC